jgi:hypothetical protein
MSYYLEDPYKYTPKCFPFIDPAKPYLREYSSNRITEKNREIEGSLVKNKHQYMSEISEENKNSEINLLKVRSLYKSLKGRGNDEIESIKAEIYGARRNKEQNLRRISHDFPEFIQHRHLLQKENTL